MTIPSITQAPINVPFAPDDLDALYTLLVAHPQPVPFARLERIVYSIRSAAGSAQEPPKAEGAPEGAPLAG